MITYYHITKTLFGRCGRLLEKVKLMLKVEPDDPEAWRN
jgi:hypothetical protein